MLTTTWYHVWCFTPKLYSRNTHCLSVIIPSVTLLIHHPTLPILHITPFLCITVIKDQKNLFKIKFVSMAAAADDIMPESSHFLWNSIPSPTSPTGNLTLFHHHAKTTKNKYHIGWLGGQKGESERFRQALLCNMHPPPLRVVQCWLKVDLCQGKLFVLERKTRCIFLLLSISPAFSKAHTHKFLLLTFI